MRYRVYSGPRGSESMSPLEKDRWLFKEYAALDDALGWAQHISDHGGVALLIEGDDGTIMNKREIAAALSSGSGRRRGPEPGGTERPDRDARNHRPARQSELGPIGRSC
jgi:hypothetical protein